MNEGDPLSALILFAMGVWVLSVMVAVGRIWTHASRTARSLDRIEKHLTGRGETPRIATEQQTETPHSARM